MDMNLYRYAYNNVSTFVDPTGLVGFQVPINGGSTTPVGLSGSNSGTLSSSPTPPTSAPTQSWYDWATGGLTKAARSTYNLWQDASYITTGSAKNAVSTTFASGQAADSAIGYGSSFVDTATHIVTLGNGTDYSNGSGLYGNREAYQGGRSVGYGTQTVQVGAITGAGIGAAASRILAYAPKAVATIVNALGRGADWLDKSQGALQIAGGDASGIEAFLPGVGGKSSFGKSEPLFTFRGDPRDVSETFGSSPESVAREVTFSWLLDRPARLGPGRPLTGEGYSKRRHPADPASISRGIRSPSPHAVGQGAPKWV